MKIKKIFFVKFQMAQDMNTLKEGVVDDNILLNSLHSFHPIAEQQLRKFVGRQPFVASLRDPDMFGAAANMSVHGESKFKYDICFCMQSSPFFYL